MTIYNYLKVQATRGRALEVSSDLLWYQPCASQLSDARGICGSWAEVDDGGEDALVVFYANILAMTDSRVVTAADACDFAYLIAGDVQAVTFGLQMGAELSVV